MMVSAYCRLRIPFQIISSIMLALETIPRNTSYTDGRKTAKKCKISLKAKCSKTSEMLRSLATRIARYGLESKGLSNGSDRRNTSENPRLHIYHCKIMATNRIWSNRRDFRNIAKTCPTSTNSLLKRRLNWHPLTSCSWWISTKRSSWASRSSTQNTCNMCEHLR